MSHMLLETSVLPPLLQNNELPLKKKHLQRASFPVIKTLQLGYSAVDLGQPETSLLDLGDERGQR